MNNQSGRKVLKGAAWMGAGRIVVNLSGFISTIVLARLLSPDDFGLVAIAMAAAAVVGSVSELSLTQALVQFDDPEDDDYHSAWTLNLLRACAISAILMAIAWPMAAAYSEPRLIPIFAVVAFTAAARALENPRIVVFRRALDFRPDFEFDVVEKIVSLVVAVAIAFVLRSYWALIFGAAAATLARVALTYIKMPYRPRFHLSRWRALMSFSIWLTFSEIVKTISLRAVPLVVGAFLPTVAVGQFSVGERVASMPVRESIGALQATLFPAFSRMANDLGRMRAAYVRAQAMTSLAALPFGFGLAAVAQPVAAERIAIPFAPPVGQQLAYDIDQHRPIAGQESRFSAHRTVRFERVGDGYQLYAVLRSLDSDASDAAAASFRAALTPLIGVEMRFHLDSQGKIIALDDDEAVWSAVEHGLETMMAQFAPDTPRHRAAQSVRTLFDGLARDGRLALLAGEYQPLFLFAASEVEDGAHGRGVRTMAGSPLGRPVPVEGVLTLQGRVADGLSLTETLAGPGVDVQMDYNVSPVSGLVTRQGRTLTVGTRTLTEKRVLRPAP